MSYIKVNLIVDGRKFTVEIAEESQYENLLDQLITALQLPLQTKEGQPIRYELSLIGAMKIKPGCTLVIREVEKHPVFFSQETSHGYSLSDDEISEKIVRIDASASQNQRDSFPDDEVFKRDHNSSRTVFVMMKFAGGDAEKDKKLKRLYELIKLSLDKFGFITVRADEKNYASTHYIWDNAQVYLNGCDYGIAILENIYLDEMNPNVALEYGYMLAKRKKVLLLKQKSFVNIRADILGKIWKEFDVDNEDSIETAIRAWMIDLGFPQLKN